MLVRTLFVSGLRVQDKGQRTRSIGANMAAPNKKMDNREIERILGQQYAQLLKENRDTSLYRDSQEVVKGSLDLLEHYNKISMLIRGSAHFKGVLT